MYYYSTQVFLAWCLNHYVFGGQHFSYVATPFFPYKGTNPTSSNPSESYRSIYQGWKDRDPYDPWLRQKRANLEKGVLGLADASYLNDGITAMLRRVCRHIDIAFLYPIVYRADINAIPRRRWELAGSGLMGSQEYLLRDLNENEFDVLFFDPTSDADAATDSDLAKLGAPLRGDSALVKGTEAITMLIGRCS